YTDSDALNGLHPRSRRAVILGVTPEVSGAFAQQISVPSRNVTTLPESMPIQYGALIEPLAVAVHAVRRTQVKPSDSVLVLGGGPIGQSVVLALKMLGVRKIVVTEVVKQRRDVISQLGALPFDARDTDLSKRVHSAFEGPADAAIDTVGIDATLSLALASTKVGAVIGLAGMGALSLSFDASRISVSERTITGTFTYTAQDFRDAAAWMGTAPDYVSLMIARQISPEQAPEEFHRLAHGGESSGKVLVMFGSETEASTAHSQSKMFERWLT
ncbi:MAG: zinc-dependent alcohol dehydrogenase, partial [Micrococcaceae bacterium]